MKVMKARTSQLQKHPLTFKITIGGGAKMKRKKRLWANQSDNNVLYFRIDAPPPTNFPKPSH